MAKILLAEDDITMVALLKTLLKMEGFEVLAVDVEADIPAAVDREKPDAIFMDVHLGDKSGMQVLQANRKNPGTSDVRVVPGALKRRPYAWHHLPLAIVS